MTTRQIHTAEYLYPGAFFSEETYKRIEEPTFEAAVAAGPDEDGLFKKDGWFAVTIRTRTEKLFRSDDGEEAWVKQSTETVGRWVIGELVPEDDPAIAGDEHTILRSNIRSNSRDPYKGYAVLARTGNWQNPSDYDHVLSDAPTLTTARRSHLR